MAFASSQGFGGNQGGHHYEEHHAHPVYKFEYSVKDTKTHDIKRQYEERDGDKLKGFYSLVQPDHKVRNVHYEADKHGFRAHVQYEGHGHESGQGQVGNAGFGGAGYGGYSGAGASAGRGLGGNIYNIKLNFKTSKVLNIMKIIFLRCWIRCRTQQWIQLR